MILQHLRGGGNPGPDTRGFGTRRCRILQLSRFAVGRKAGHRSEAGGGATELGEARPPAAGGNSGKLEWRRPLCTQAEATQVESVRHSLLRFYNGELFQIVTTYDGDGVEGLTELDKVEATFAYLWDCHEARS
jgi:hypothetical protein